MMKFLGDPRFRGDDVTSRQDLSVITWWQNFSVIPAKAGISSIIFCLAFLAGDLFLQTFSYLPSYKWFYLIGLLVMVVAWACFLRPGFVFNLFLGFVAGFIYTAWYASSNLAWTLPKAWEDQNVIAVGYVASLPTFEQGKANFIFSLEKLYYQEKVSAASARVRLSWPSTQALRVGDKWQLAVRLKRIHSTQNPGAIDFESVALQKQLRATGKVLNNSANQFLSHSYFTYPIEQFRQFIQAKISPYLPHSLTAPWLMALILGERQGVNQSDWQILRNTGTNHLMAIGGLHIGALVAMIYFLINWYWRHQPLFMSFLPAQLASASIALCFSLVYISLSGFAIPAQRAGIMLTIFILYLFLRRQVFAWQVWSVSLLMVLILNPLSTLNESFWLSFGTIALIIYSMSGRLAPGGWWWKWGRIQWIIGLGLIPFSLLFFQQTALTSFLANSIAIPWLEFFILPFCLLSIATLFVSSIATEYLLWVADKSLATLWQILTWISHWHFSIWIQTIPNTILLLLTLGGILLLLLPAGLKGRWLGVLWLIPLICFQPEKPKAGEVWMTLLDVGQGLSVIIQTAKHVLVFDAGPRTLKMDMGENVVLPYLHKMGVKQIDMLVISHADNDHRGGAQALLQALPVKSIKTSVPEKFPSSLVSYCLANMRWRWDGIDFEFLSPFSDTLHLGNNSSCVLKISNAHKTILLTGDIEKEAEQYLLQRSPSILSADILVAPHHGSKTSSTEDFVNAIHPQYVLYATGYLNRYHFPHTMIVDQYRKIGATQLNTVDTGTVTMKISDENIQVTKYREIEKKYWWD